jgi:hypothetical protein
MLRRYAASVFLGCLALCSRCQASIATLDLGPWTLDLGPWTLDLGRGSRSLINDTDLAC